MYFLLLTALKKIIWIIQLCRLFHKLMPESQFSGPSTDRTELLQVNKKKHSAKQWRKPIWGETGWNNCVSWLRYAGVTPTRLRFTDRRLWKTDGIRQNRSLGFNWLNSWNSFSLVILGCKVVDSQGFQEQECVLFPFFKLAPAQNTDPNTSVKWCF